MWIEPTHRLKIKILPLIEGSGNKARETVFVSALEVCCKDREGFVHLSRQIARNRELRNAVFDRRKKPSFKPVPVGTRCLT